LDLDDGLGLFELTLKLSLLPIGLGQRRGQRVGRRGLRPALERFQRLEGAGVALSAPVGQRRRVQTFPAQNGCNPAGVCRSIRLAQNPQLLRSREGPAFRAGRQFWGGCSGRSNNPRRLAGVRGGASFNGRQGCLVGHDHAMNVLRPRA
jgi:hypothetical protein